MARLGPKTRDKWKNEVDAFVPKAKEKKPYKPLPGQRSLFGEDTAAPSPEDDGKKANG